MNSPLLRQQLFSMVLGLAITTDFLLRPLFVSREHGLIIETLLNLYIAESYQASWCAKTRFKNYYMVILYHGEKMQTILHLDIE